MRDFQYDKAEVGQRIKKRRSMLRLTQEQLAEKIDKSHRLMIDLERGAVGLSMETLFALCRVLKVTPNDLLMPDATPSDGELDWLVQTLSLCPEHERKTAIEIARAYLRSL